MVRLCWPEKPTRENLDQKGSKLVPVSAWESPPFPHYQWTIRGDVDATFGAGFTERVRAAPLSNDDPAILDMFDRSGAATIAASTQIRTMRMGSTQLEAPVDCIPPLCVT